jgi:alkanesulfonate monooxygenase SsuD/methylene tetrahydromethanopterin reductase-like flavin-dependent oxidoreductase (luciferase family)
VKVFLFHLMPYAHLDMGYTEKYRAAWVVLPNTYFDPKKGHELYNRYLDELELAAELGFDGISVNEHHQNAYGLMPSPVVTAAALSRRVKQARIAILGSAFCLREHPLNIAEEHAMIDCITGGRLISGMVRGIGAEYYSTGNNPAFSHARFQEAHDLVVQAWTKPGPFAFEGKFYHFEYVNMWPRPYQQPHPPIWAPSTGSTETIEWAAHPSHKYTYLQAYSPTQSVARYLNYYRECAQRMYGYTASSDQIAGRLRSTSPTMIRRHATRPSRTSSTCSTGFSDCRSKCCSRPAIFPPNRLRTCAATSARSADSSTPSTP